MSNTKTQLHQQSVNNIRIKYFNLTLFQSRAPLSLNSTAYMVAPSTASSSTIAAVSAGVMLIVGTLWGGSENKNMNNIKFNDNNNLNLNRY